MPLRGGLAFSPDGTYLAISAEESRDVVHMWNTATGEITSLTGKPFSWIRFLEFSPTGTTLLCGGEIMTPVSLEESIQVWEVESRTQRAILTDPKNRILDLEYSPDGAIVAGGYFNETVILWEVATGQKLDVWDLDFPIDDIEVSPLGNVIAISTSGDWEAHNYQGFELRDFATGLKLTEHVIPTWEIDIPYLIGIEFNPDGDLLASDSWDVVESMPIVDLWSFDSTETTPTLNYLLSVEGGVPVFSPDGAILATTDEKGHWILWNTTTFEQLIVLDATGLVTFSQDGSLVVSGNTIWDVATGKRLKVIEGAEDLMLSPDRKLVAFFRNDAVELWGVPADE